jgi:predicted SprT family Zn-dependent metalloprotease
MGVDDNDGHMMVNSRYLNNGDKTDISLDVVHELCHVKQHLEGRELFDPAYDYVNNPTEVEAYRYTVKEAKRLGLSDKRILLYLQTEWMSDADLKQLVKNIGIDLHDA